MMQRPCYSILFAFFLLKIYAQPNCDAFMYYKDTLKYEACKKAEQIADLYQFSKEYQKILDEAIEIDPTFAYPYRKKSVAYLKSGDFITWKALIDKAVKYNPLGNLEYRALMRFKCFRDYHGALKDFKKMDSLGFQTEHLNVARALCYDAVGEKEKAVQILEDQIEKGKGSLGLFGHLHLAVFYLEQKKYKRAVQLLSKQNAVNKIAESCFYLALSYKGLQLHSECTSNLEIAKKLYLQEVRMSDNYVDLIHKIYLGDIESELRKSL